jgi:excisionase family DNA binding protein
MRQYFRPDEVAEIFRFSLSTIYKLIKTGELRAIKIRSLWRIPKNVIEAVENGETT